MFKKFTDKYFILLIILIIPAFSALLIKGFFPMHDDIQAMRVLQMQRCIEDFQIPCRWVPDMGYGYGYPQFNYYAPLPYYVMVIPVFLSASILTSVKFGFGLSIIAAAASMYFLGKRLWGSVGGVISALFYTYAPYRAVDVYVRGAMGEAWAFVFLPLILLFTIILLENNKKAILPLAISVAGLAITHNITMLMFIPFYTIFVLLKWLEKPTVSKIKYLSLSGIWGIALSAFFVFPAFFEKSYVHVDTIIQGYFNFLAHYVGIKQLLFSTFWGYGDSVLGTLDGMSITIGLIIWLVPSMVFLLSLILKDTKTSKNVFVYLLLSAIAVFLIHPKSVFIWDKVEIFSYIQFPWRFLALCILFLSIAAGALSKYLRVYKFKSIIIIFLVLMVFYGNFFKPSKILDITDEDKFGGENWQKQKTISIYDYLPVWANEPPTGPAYEAPFSNEFEVEVVEKNSGSNWQNWKLNLAKAGKVIFPVYYFPNWVAEVNGKDIEIDYNNHLGLISLDLYEGEQLVVLKLKNTPLRTASNLVTLLALCAIPIYTYKKKS